MKLLKNFVNGLFVPKFDLAWLERRAFSRVDGGMAATRKKMPAPLSQCKKTGCELNQFNESQLTKFFNNFMFRNHFLYTKIIPKHEIIEKFRQWTFRT